MLARTGLAPRTRTRPGHQYGIRLDPWTQGSGSGARGQGLDEIADKIPERNSGMKYGLSNPGNSQFSFPFKPSQIADESYFIEASNFSPGFSVIFSQTKQFPVCTTCDCDFQILK